jgi:uncharacterized membrane protein YgcG
VFTLNALLLLSRLLSSDLLVVYIGTTLNALLTFINMTCPIVVAALELFLTYPLLLALGRLALRYWRLGLHVVLLLVALLLRLSSSSSFFFRGGGGGRGGGMSSGGAGAELAGRYERRLEAFVETCPKPVEILMSASFGHHH